MTHDLEFTVPGVCVPQSRPRAHRIGERVIVHDAPKSISYKMDVASCAQKAIERTGIEVPVIPSGKGFEVRIIIHKALLKSFSKKKAQKALNGKILPLSKPDLDNAAKGILDALTGVFWRDDSAVTHLDVRKDFAEMDGTEVVIYWEGEE